MTTAPRPLSSTSVTIVSRTVLNGGIFDNDPNPRASDRFDNAVAPLRSQQTAPDKTADISLDIDRPE
jgi:hypothetical protein